jgi:hypothetical protein
MNWTEAGTPASGEAADAVSNAAMVSSAAVASKNLICIFLSPSGFSSLPGFPFLVPDRTARYTGPSFNTTVQSMSCSTGYLQDRMLQAAAVNSLLYISAHSLKSIRKFW